MASEGLPVFMARPSARAAKIPVFVGGVRVLVPASASAAAALLLANLPSPPWAYCMMGACFDCRAVIDGVADRKACMTPVAPGMRIEPQRAADATS